MASGVEAECDEPVGRRAEKCVDPPILRDPRQSAMRGEIWEGLADTGGTFRRLPKWIEELI